MTLKYENSKIFVIKSTVNLKIPVYIGYTTSTSLCSTIAQIKQRYALGKITKDSEPDLFLILESKKFKYNLVKSIPCNNVDELRAERNKVRDEYSYKLENIESSSSRCKKLARYSKKIKIDQPNKLIDFVVTF